MNVSFFGLIWTLVLCERLGDFLCSQEIIEITHEDSAAPLDVGRFLVSPEMWLAGWSGPAACNFHNT